MAVRRGSSRSAATSPGQPAPTPLIGSVDVPAEGDVVGRRPLVHGWAAPTGRVDRVDLFVDGRPVDVARLCWAPRDDVVDALGDPTAVMCGFAGKLDLTGMAAGDAVTVRVEAVSGAERTLIGERNVVVGGDPSPDDMDLGWVNALAARVDIAARSCVPGGGVRLLVVTHHLGLGGAQLWLQRVLDRLLAGPDTTCTVVAPADGPLRHRLEAAGARVHLTGPMPPTGGAYESMVRSLVLLAADDGCNVALVNTVGSFIGVDAASRCGIPAVLAVHEHFELDDYWDEAFGRPGLDHHVRARGVRAVEHQAKVVCFVTEATRRLYLDHRRSEDLVTVEYDVPLDHHRASRAGLDRSVLRVEHGYAPGDTVLLCVATVEARKSQSLLVAALARLADAHPGAQLILLGDEGGPYGCHLGRMVEGHGLGRRVRIVPATDDVAPWYVMADAFVLCSDVESKPRAIMEAMAYGLPVVATAVGGVPELVRHGDTGLLCRRRDLGSITESIDTMLSMEPAGRVAMGQRGADAIEARDDSAYALAFERLVTGLTKDADADAGWLLRGG